MTTREETALKILGMIEEFTQVDAEYLHDPDDPESEVMLGGSAADHAEFLYELMEIAGAFDAPRARLLAEHKNNFDPEELIGEAFYSTSLLTKEAALDRLVGREFDPHVLLDALADGCGGCERLGLSTPNGRLAWISVLASVGDRRTRYVYLEFQGNLLCRWEFMERPDQSDSATDDPATYIDVAQAVWAFDDAKEE